MVDKVYIIDYDSVTYVGDHMIVKEIDRERESVLFTDKSEMLKILGKFIDDKCIENINISVSTLQRDPLNMDGLLNG